MATILDFRALRGRSGASASRSPGPASAEIVIFPGIRYERWDDETAASQPRKRSQQARDRLELED